MEKLTGKGKHIVKVGNHLHKYNIKTGNCEENTNAGYWKYI